MGEVRREERHWNRLAANDPMWVILTEPGKRGVWEAEDFYATGRREIAEALALLSGEFGLTPRFQVALDFGCGLGRLSQALAERFTQVHGVDISSVMIDQARTNNRHGARVTYHVNVSDRLPMVADGSVDFACSRITLQHIPRVAMRSYIRELVRILAADGIAMFQVLTRSRSWKTRVRHRVRDLAPDLYRWLRDVVTRRTRWEMNTISEQEVRDTVHGAGGRVVGIVPDGIRDPEYDSRWVIVTKRG